MKAVVGKHYKIKGYSIDFNGKQCTVVRRDGGYVFVETWVEEYPYKIEVELYDCELEEMEEE